jgi:hypothetical protein
MNGENSVNRDALLETFAAELTPAAYCVALRARTQGNWLDLWKALADKAKTWRRRDCISGLRRRSIALPAPTIR